MAIRRGKLMQRDEKLSCFPAYNSSKETKITFFGTSARYLAAVMDSGSKPGREFDLSKLRILASTGSPATSNIFKVKQLFYLLLETLR
jgi:hypothetical protein